MDYEAKIVGSTIRVTGKKTSLEYGDTIITTTTQEFPNVNAVSLLEERIKKRRGTRVALSIASLSAAISGIGPTLEGLKANDAMTSLPHPVLIGLGISAIIAGVGMEAYTLFRTRKGIKEDKKIIAAVNQLGQDALLRRG